MTDRSRCRAGSRMEPEAEDLQAELSDEHWLLVNRAVPAPVTQRGSTDEPPAS